MRRKFIIIPVLLLFGAHLHADTCWVRLTIDTITPDSFIIQRPSLEFLGSALIGDTITKSRFIIDLFNRFDSANIAFIGKVDTVIRVSFQEGMIWMFKDSIKVGVDAVLKGTIPDSYWFIEVDQRYLCDSPGVIDNRHCEYSMDESYRGYGVTQGKPFIAFGENIASLRNTSISPSNCIFNKGNYIINDTIYSDYFDGCPKVKIDLHDFLLLLKNRSMGIQNHSFASWSIPFHATQPNFSQIFDILGRRRYFHFGQRYKENLPPGVYFFLDSKNRKTNKTITFPLNTVR
jgi:hypothetical protein